MSEEFEDWLRQGFEPLQYLAFFGTLAVFMLAEATIPLFRGAPHRKERWPANYLLTLLNILVLSAVPVSGLFAADYAASQNLGLIWMLPLPAFAAIGLGVLARSLVSYLIHVAMHKAPLLWRVHRVHHSDAVLDVSTAVRFHPLEFAVSTPLLLLAIVALGIPPIAIILYELFDAAMAVWTHANIRLPRAFDRTAGLLLVTPSMHRVHHSSFHRETDSNYGATLSVWDRLFGTYCERSEDQLANMAIGLKQCRDARSGSLLWLLKLPFLRRLALEPPERQS